jgi:hypothetical protein
MVHGLPINLWWVQQWISSNFLILAECKHNYGGVPCTRNRVFCWETVCGSASIPATCLVYMTTNLCLHRLCDSSSG